MKKKLGMILMILLSCFGLFACDPAFGKIGDFVVLEIISVELIEYDNTAAKRINTGFFSDNVKAANKMPALDLEKLKILEELVEDEFDSFLEDFSDINMSTAWVHLNSPIGICLKLNYENGDFLIVSCGQFYEKSDSIICKYSANGEPLTYEGEIDAEGFKSIANKYFDRQIE